MIMNKSSLAIRYLPIISVALLTIKPAIADSITDGLTITGGNVTIGASGANALSVATSDNRTNSQVQVKGEICAWSASSTNYSDLVAGDYNYYNNGSPTWAGGIVRWFGFDYSGNISPYVAIPYAGTAYLGGQNCNQLVIATNGAVPIYFANASGIAATIQPDSSTSFFGVIPTSGSAPASGEVRIGGGDIEMGGVLYATEIKVNSNGWPDYVFDEGYRLKSLNEVEQYIAQEKHLPDIASAKEIAASGVPVSEMVTKQLAKIEELTLYAIDADKRTSNIEDRLKAMENENADLKLRLAHIETLLEKP